MHLVKQNLKENIKKGSTLRNIKFAPQLSPWQQNTKKCTEEKRTTYFCTSFIPLESYLIKKCSIRKLIVVKKTRKDLLHMSRRLLLETSKLYREKLLLGTNREGMPPYKISILNINLGDIKPSQTTELKISWWTMLLSTNLDREVWSYTTFYDRK